MRFIILMSADPSWDELSSAEQAQVLAAHERFEADLRAAGGYLGSERFGPDPGMSVVQSAVGSQSVTAAPEPGRGAIGGYYLIDAEDMDRALAWASRCRFIPGTNWVYPIRED